MAEELYCEINGDSRIIDVPEKYRYLGVESDEKANTVKFRCPKIVGNNIDLTRISLRVNFKNANGEPGQDIITNIKTEGDQITFSWTLSRLVTRYKGNVHYIVCAVETDEDGSIQIEWNTAIAVGTVREGLEVNPIEPTEDERDTMAQLLSIMNKNVTITTEAAKSASQSERNASTSETNAKDSADRIYPLLPQGAFNTLQKIVLSGSIRDVGQSDIIPDIKKGGVFLIESRETDGLDEDTVYEIRWGFLISTVEIDNSKIHGANNPVYVQRYWSAGIGLDKVLCLSRTRSDWGGEIKGEWPEWDVVTTDGLLAPIMQAIANINNKLSNVYTYKGSVYKSFQLKQERGNVYNWAGDDGIIDTEAVADFSHEQLGKGSFTIYGIGSYSIDNIVNKKLYAKENGVTTTYLIKELNGNQVILEDSTLDVDAHDYEKAYLFLNIPVHKGDNLAYNGCLWDKLAGTIDLSGYAPKATSLAGYGIKDAYTQTQVDNLIYSYRNFGSVDSNGVWDFSKTDKITTNVDVKSITKLYDGAVGMIKTTLELTLPNDETTSKKSADYGYMQIGAGQHYLYTFLYDGTYYHWTRTVCG